MLTSDQIKKELLGLKISDITATYIYNTFAYKVEYDTENKPKVLPPRIAPNSKFYLEKEEYFNSGGIQTTAGRFLFNKLILEEDYLKHIGYVNAVLNSSGIKSYENKLKTLTLEKTTSIEAFHKYLNRLEWLQLQFNSIFGSSFSPNTIKPVPAAIELRDELVSKNKQDLEKGDVILSVDIEKKVLGMAKKVLKDDHGLEMYDSGARGSFDGNYKPMFGMAGATYNSNEQKWDIITTNFNDGIQKKNIASYGNMIVSGNYPKSIGTAVAGYKSKELSAAFQDVVLDPPGTDCGSKGYIELVFTKWIADQSLYSTILVNNKEVFLTPQNINNYIGKSVKMRSPVYCKSDNVCPVCAGQIFHKLGITNMGLTVSRAATTLVNAGMKKFHVTTTKLAEIDLNSITL